MSLTRSRRRTMSRSLARSSSVSLILPLAPQQQAAAILCTLRRAHSSIPAVDCPTPAGGDQARNPNGNYRLAQPGVDEEQDSYCSDCTSCGSSVTEYFDQVDEPQRVSKDVLRSLSLSFKWLELPFQEFDLPACRDDLQRMNSFDKALSSDASSVRKPLVAGKQDSIRYAYIHECRTGQIVGSHVELKTAMDSLQHWTMQAPRNCCLSYRHDVSGEVATLPWPDLEAGGAEEIEEFVSTVNRMEGIPVFFPRYQRLPYYSLSSTLSSTPSLPPLSPAVSGISKKIPSGRQGRR